jgi:hypothetical protein
MHTIPMQDEEGRDTFVVGEINCSCVGIATQLSTMAPKVVCGILTF